MLNLPQPPNVNERTLAQMYHERVTGSTASSLTLTNTPATTQDGANLVRVYKNGSLMDDQGGAGGYTISGKTITLGAALVGTDIVHIYYHYRV